MQDASALPHSGVPSPQPLALLSITHVPHPTQQPPAHPPSPFSLHVAYPLRASALPHMTPPPDPQLPCTPGTWRGARRLLLSAPASLLPNACAAPPCLQP